MTARTRDLSPETEHSTSYYWNVVTKTGVRTESTSDYISAKGKDVMHDVVVRNFRKLVSSGRVIVNPMYHVTSKFSQGGGSYTGHSSLSSYGRENWNLTEANLAVSGTDDAEFLPTNLLNYGDILAIAKQSAIADMDKTPRRMMEDLLEFKKTVDLLRHPMEPALELAKKFNKARTGFLRRGFSYANATAKAWLTVRFAYGSLVYSMMSVHDAVLDDPLLASRKNARLRSSGYSDSSKEDNVTVTRTTGSQVRVFDQHVTDTYVARAGIIYEKSLYNPSSLAFRNGLRLKDVPRGIWNVMPYTWVTDRFLDVANTVSGVVNLLDPTISILGAFASFHHKGTHDVTLTSFTPSTGQYIDSWNPDTMHSEFESWSRQPWTPKLSDTLPTLDFKAAVSDSLKIADLATLVVSRLTSTKSR